MKKILLRAAGVRSEMCRGELKQFLFAHAAARKIQLPQCALHPDIHRKRGIEAIGEQQDAIGDFPADAAQFHQFGSRRGIIQPADFFQIKFADGDFPRGGEQMRGAKTHLARAEISFGQAGDLFG